MSKDEGVHVTGRKVFDFRGEDGEFVFKNTVYDKAGIARLEASFDFVWRRE